MSTALKAAHTSVAGARAPRDANQLQPARRSAATQPAWLQAPGAAAAACLNLRELLPPSSRLPGVPPPASRRYQGSADAVRKNLGELRDEARGVTPARDYIILSGSGEAAAPLILPSHACKLAGRPLRLVHAASQALVRCASLKKHCEGGSIAVVSPCQPGFGVWLSPEAFRQQAHAARVQPPPAARCPRRCATAAPAQAPAKAAPPSLLLDLGIKIRKERSMHFPPGIPCPPLQPCTTWIWPGWWPSTARRTPT